MPEAGAPTSDGGNDGGNRPVAWPDVFFAECRALDPSFAEGHPSTQSTGTPDSAARLQALNRAAFAQGHSALCLSGGGIRSASFAVGVLQGLARHGLIQQFTYLSTVSGGGFAGAWLTSWLHRANREPRARDAKATAESAAAQEALNQLTDGVTSPGQVEPWPLSRLRQYTRYLSPKAGALSADSWALAATMLRNLLLNWCVLVPLLAGVMLVPRVHYAVIHLSEREIDPAARFLISGPEAAVLLVAMLGVLASVAFAAGDLPSYGNRRRSEHQFLLRGLLPMCLGAFALTYFWALNQVEIPLSAVLLTAAVLHTGGWMLVGFATGNRPFRPRTWIAAAVSGLLVGVVCYGLMIDVWGVGVELHKAYIAFAFPLLLASVLLGMFVLIGFAGSDISSADLEWWSRDAAWMLIVMAAWLAVCAIVFGGPWAIHRLERLIPHLTSGLVAATPLLGGLSSWLARPSGERGEPSPIRRIGLLIAAPLFAVLLLVGVAYADDEAVRHLATWPSFRAAEQRHLDLCDPDREERANENQCHPAGAGLLETLSLGAALFALGFGMSRFVPANKFSLHGMYRQRLTRAYLGSSRLTREPNPFTGFDPADDLELCRLSRQRPLHVVNVTLNKRNDAQLGRQERKAESFTFSPLYAGSATLGYRSTMAYAYDDAQRQAVTLGTAITISGAAASPEMGALSTPTRAFLFTLLNARLGIWLGNPGTGGARTWRRSDPTAGVMPIIREMLGLTTDVNPYVYLSDGGHFDNLGLWEMVLRRCKYIVIVDAGCDPDYTFADLANAVRQVRIDHGVQIDLDPIAMDRAHQGAGNAHVVSGRIRYQDADGGDLGTLIYIKPALSGDEAVDVVNYYKAHPAFPHESTANQWFSEAQFESYRMLGRHSAEVALADRSETGFGPVSEAIRAARARG